MKKQGLWLWLAVMLAASAHAQPQTMTVSVIENDPPSDVIKIIIQKAYASLGIDVIFKAYSGKRALVMSNKGASDAELVRIEGTEKRFPNLIRIPVPLYEIHGLTYTRHVDKEIRTWSDLKGLRVGIIRGIQYSELGTRGLRRYYAKNVDHLFRLLDSNRIDVAIAIRKGGNMTLDHSFAGSGIHVIGPPLYEAALYHFVHKKHRDLVPMLEKALKDMKESGEMKTLIDRTPIVPLAH